VSSSRSSSSGRGSGGDGGGGDVPSPQYLPAPLAPFIEGLSGKGVRRSEQGAGRRKEEEGGGARQGLVVEMRR